MGGGRYYLSCTLWVEFENIYHRTILALVTQIHSDKRYEQICFGGNLGGCKFIFHSLTLLSHHFDEGDKRFIQQIEIVSRLT